MKEELRAFQAAVEAATSLPGVTVDETVLHVIGPQPDHRYAVVRAARGWDSTTVERVIDMCVTSPRDICVVAAPDALDSLVRTELAFRGLNRRR